MESGTLVIGTAGHIDHGKTSLVHALTGIDLDRLPEERERGITIALGFTHLDLASGRRAAFVDVPGHERLVRTMIAGATGLDAALLCVSAVEGVMPQTREHLAILRLLGLRHGVVALTMTDLADEETMELATMDVEELVEGTFLEDAPIVRTAAGPVARGINDLVKALDALPLVDRSQDGPFRLAIDRCFIQRGFGTVVTGTVRSGALADGADVAVLPGGHEARVRGLQVHGKAEQTTHAGLRTALNLAGIERDDLSRGQVVVQRDSLEVASILDVRIALLAGVPPLEDGRRVRLLVGTAEVMATVTLVDEGEPGLGDRPAVRPGSSALVQLRTERPIVALPGDHFVLRRESPVTTLGGGTILDPWAPRVRARNRIQAREQLVALEGGDPSVFLTRAGERGLSELECQLRASTPGHLLGERHYHPDQVALFEAALLADLVDWHRDNPLDAGVTRRALHRGLLAALENRAYDALVLGMLESGALAANGPQIHRPGFSVTLDGDQRAAAATISEALQSVGLDGMKPAEIPMATPALLHHLISKGELVKVSDRLLHRPLLDGLVEDVRALLTDREAMSPADFKELTGLSRRMAIPLLEWLDEAKVTKRQGDARVLR